MQYQSSQRHLEPPPYALIHYESTVTEKLTYGCPKNNLGLFYRNVSFALALAVG